MFGHSYLRRLVDGGNTRKFLSFKVFEHGTTAGGYITHLISESKHIHGCNRISATHQGKGTVFSCLCNSQGDRAGTMTETFHFKHAHRAVPENGFRSFNDVGKLFSCI